MKSVARFFLFLFLALVVTAGFLFAMNNAAPVTLWLGVAFAPKPLAAWILLAFISGAFAGIVLGYGLWRRIRLGMQVATLRKRLDAAERELSKLRQKPDSNVHGKSQST